MKIKYNATGYFVVYKEDGLICSFQRKPDGTMKRHDHYKTALNALKKLGANDGFQDGWFIVSSVALKRAKWGNV
jgi:hypothetical protein